MGLPQQKSLQHQKDIYSPVSHIRTSRKMPERLLRPLSEGISKSAAGGCLYKNKEGEVFSASARYTHIPKSLQVPMSGAIVIEEIGGAYKVIAEFRHDAKSDSLHISYIHNSSSPLDFKEPAEERKGHGFFGIVVEHAKRIAREFGLITLSTQPTNSRLKHHYEKYGFEGRLRWMTCRVE